MLGHIEEKLGLRQHNQRLLCYIILVSSQFNYEAGKTYEFTYETELRTAIQGASEEHAGVHLTATVHMDFLSKCEMVMRVSLWNF